MLRPNNRFLNRVDLRSSRQKARIVPTNISARPGRSPSAWRVRVTIRSFNSAAAFSVKVNAMMLAGRRESGRPGVSKCTTRRATTSVLPEPAQAMSWRLRPLCSTARRWESVRFLGIHERTRRPGWVAAWRPVGQGPRGGAGAQRGRQHSWLQPRVLWMPRPSRGRFGRS